jgi:hypothetical protein
VDLQFTDVFAQHFGLGGDLKKEKKRKESFHSP